MSSILILNGPNLNMLGMREPDIYGHETLEDIDRLCHDFAKERNITITCKQSNHEGELIDWIQAASNEEEKQKYEGIIINAAAYTHTSLAIHDALKAVNLPVIEVHLSNPKQREEFRHFSYIEPVAQKVISGHKSQGYIMALEEMLEILSKK